MGKVKDLRLFIAEDIVNDCPVIDLDVAFIMADELWEEAMKDKDPRAIERLNKIVKAWEKGA